MVFYRSTAFHLQKGPAIWDFHVCYIVSPSKLSICYSIRRIYNIYEITCFCWSSVMWFNCHIVTTYIGNIILYNNIWRLTRSNPFSKSTKHRNVIQKLHRNQDQESGNLYLHRPNKFTRAAPQILQICIVSRLALQNLIITRVFGPCHTERIFGDSIYIRIW